jgi:hypothetical protein
MFLEESIVLLMNAGLMALCHGAFYFLVVGHYLFVYWPAKRRHSIPPSSLCALFISLFFSVNLLIIVLSASVKERDPELVLLDMEFEGLFESEKQRRKRAEQRNPIMIRLCQRLFVGFIGIFQL